MILKPNKQDIRAIGYYLGKITVGLSLTMSVPILMGLISREFNPALDFVIGMNIGLAFGLYLIKACHTEHELNWMQGMVVVSLAWLVAMFLSSVPMYLSGNWKSYLDACFDSMSGFATTGLSLVQDLEHMSLTHNLWRHFIMFLGGQGIVVIALSFFVKGASGVFKMYVGEAREEQIMPNVINTSRFIWLVSLAYLVLGTLSLGIIGMANGLTPLKSLFHGACIFMAAFDTGGFAPYSQSILYYHSFVFEIATVIFMVLGAINFKLHYHLLIGNRREILKNIETVTFFITVITLFSVTAVGLDKSGIYPKAALLFGKGFYQFISGHTGTGFQTIYSGQFVSDWSHLSLAGIILAMGIGGAVCSTTGAIKLLRVGIIFKAFVEDIKRIILSERAVVIQRFHHIREVFLSDRQARSALLITLAYLVLYVAGSLVGMFYGYPFFMAVFESTSAAANVGLSCGITNPSMPQALKITYMIQMWAGRLEFMSVFALLGFFVAVFKGKR